MGNTTEFRFGKWRDLNSQLLQEQQSSKLSVKPSDNTPKAVRKDYIVGCHIAQKADSGIAHNPTLSSSETNVAQQQIQSYLKS